MPDLVTLARHASFGGTQGFFEHASDTTQTPMRWSLYLPPQATAERVPVVLWLSGLTCTEQTFAMKAGAQRVAAELGLALLSPDTSPRHARPSRACARAASGDAAGGQRPS